MVHSIAELSFLIEDTEEMEILGEIQDEVVQQAFRLSGKRVCDCRSRSAWACFDSHLLDISLLPVTAW
jgi:hypothetical protein